MSETVARIRIELEDTDPLVWRELDLPMSTTLAALHDIIQVVMHWWDYHLYEFVIGGKIYGEPHPDDEIYERKVYKAKAIRLGILLHRDVRAFLYVYDFGDNWRHRITVESVRQGDPDTEYPKFIAGARRAPPEDVGGITWFEEFLEAVSYPEHEDHERLLEWYGKPFDPEYIDERSLHVSINDFAARRRGPLLRHRGDARKKPL